MMSKENGLKYDPVKEQYKVLANKVREINEYLKDKTITDDNIKEIQDVMKNMEPINKMLIALREHVSKEDQYAEGPSTITEFHKSENSDNIS